MEDEEVDLTQVDRVMLFDRIAEIEAAARSAALEEELDVLCWCRDMFYLVDEGFMFITKDGKCYPELRCPNTL